MSYDQDLEFGWSGPPLDPSEVRSVSQSGDSGGGFEVTFTPDGSSSGGSVAAPAVTVDSPVATPAQTAAARDVAQDTTRLKPFDLINAPPGATSSMPDQRRVALPSGGGESKELGIIGKILEFARENPAIAGGIAAAVGGLGKGYFENKRPMNEAEARDWQEQQRIARLQANSKNVKINMRPKV